MVAPTAFEFNTITAEDNHFMSSDADAGSTGGHGGHGGGGGAKEASRARVLREYAGLYDTLANKVGLNVHLFQHEASHGTPDACFPNNWFTTHGSGELGTRTLALYPLKSPNRRLERRKDIIDYIQSTKAYDRVVDLSEYVSQSLPFPSPFPPPPCRSETREEAGEEAKRWGNPHEKKGMAVTETETAFVFSSLPLPRHEAGATFLEGTGCLVLDRANRVAYAALSERCHLGLAEQWAEQMGYDSLVPFRSLDPQSNPV